MYHKWCAYHSLGNTGLKDTLDGLAKAGGVQWYGHVLRRDDGKVFRRALDFKVVGRRGCGKYDMEKISGRTYSLDWTEKGKCH